MSPPAKASPPASPVSDALPAGARPKKGTGALSEPSHAKKAPDPFFEAVMSNRLRGYCE